MSSSFVPRPRGQRLSTLNRPESLRVMKPARHRGTPAAAQKCCDSPQIRDNDGQRVCESCGSLIAEQNIVAEVTFSENAAGGAVMLGQSVGENQRHARGSGPGFRRIGGVETRNQAMETGNREIQGLLNTLNIRSEVVREQASKIYGLALYDGFIQGRRTRTVAAVCIYLVCRMNRDYTLLLMDLAEKIQVNVFHLGDTYKELKEQLYIQEPANVAGVSPVIDIESLVMRFATKLEFGDKTIQVASDAVAILRRMKRDWMAEGRQPAGLCGACLLMAARANNFRRTTREVVFIVRIGDATVGRRMFEFRKTPASKMSIQQFRKTGQNGPTMTKPPALYRAEAREQRRRQKFKRLQQMAEDTGSERPQELRRDGDGFLIPPIPIDPQLMQASEHAQPSLDVTTDAPPEPEQALGKRKRGRPPKTVLEVPVPTAQELAEERALESEIERIMRDPENIKSADEAMTVEVQLRAEENAKSLAEQRGASNAAELDELQELDADPEIAHCVLSAIEIDIKERIWVTANEDWLRSQQGKMLRQVLEEARGARKKNTRRKKRRTDDNSGDPPPKDAAEGVMRDLQSKRLSKSFSKHINYEALMDVYVTPGNSSRESSVATNSAERAASNGPGTPAGPVRRGSSVSVAPLPLQSRGLATPPSSKVPNAPAQTKGGGDDEYEVVEEIEDDEDGAKPIQAGATRQDTRQEDDEEDDEEDEDEDEEEYDEEEQDFEEAIGPLGMADDWEGEEY